MRLLLIAESAPDDGGESQNRRFFYDSALTRHDGLFREVCKVVLGTQSLVSGPEAKIPYLAALKEKGVFLIDLAVKPVNYLSPESRRSMLMANIDFTLAEARRLDPEGLVVCKANVFRLLEERLRAANLPLLHDEPIPFPGNGHQATFRSMFADAIAPLNLTGAG